MGPGNKAKLLSKQLLNNCCLVVNMLQGQASCESACVEWHHPSRTVWDLHLRMNLCPTVHQHSQSYTCTILKDVFADHHLFMQENDPKHTSKHAQRFLAKGNINWWKTPPESPDLKNLWHELKEFIRHEVKPKTKQELVDGILAFWDTADKTKWTRTLTTCKKLYLE